MANTLVSFSDELAQLVEAFEPQTIRVEARKRLPASGIVWSKDGIIVTANHVVRKEKEITLGFSNGDMATADLLGRDPASDIAVLKVEGRPLKEGSWLDDSDMKVGSLVLALGRPAANVMATFGVISAVSERWRTPAGGWLDTYLQTDVVMYPGFSGGPLVAAQGALVGMNTSGLLRGVSTTITRSTLNRVVGAILSHGRVRRGYLGVSLQPVKLQTKDKSLKAQETGLLVVGVEEGSPAAAGGIIQGDVLVNLGDSPIYHLDDLLRILESEAIGEKIPLVMVRGGQVQTVIIEIGERE